MTAEASDTLRSRWRLYGLSIDAPFALPGAAQEDDTGEPDLVIQWSSGIAQVPGPNPAEDKLTKPGEIVLWEGPDGASALVWPDEICLHYAPDGRTLSIVSRPEKLTYLPTVLVGIGLGWLLQRRGRLCLHGTAVAWQGRAIGVLGPSGAGKSTLAATLVQRGAQLLTDDVIVLRRAAEGLLVEPGCSSIRMLPDTVAQHGLTGAPMQPVPWIDKQLWQPQQAAPARAVPLDRLVLLRPVGAAGTAPVLQPLSAMAALSRLTPHWYPPQLSRHMTPDHFRQLAALAQQHPVGEVAYAHAWAHLDQLATHLLPEAR